MRMKLNRKALAYQLENWDQSTTPAMLESSDEGLFQPMRPLVKHIDFILKYCNDEPK